LQRENLAFTTLEAGSAQRVSRMSVPRLEYDPREIRERKDLAPIEWVPSLGCWCVFAAEEIAFVLKSHDFVVADFTDLHQKLAQKVGIDCSAAVEALGHIAIAHEGERHARIRKDTARILKADLALTKQNTAEAAKEIVSKICQPGSSIDLVRDIVRPVCDVMFANILGVGSVARSDAGVSASQIFDIYLGLNRRAKINAEASNMLEAFTSAQRELKTSPGYAVGLTMLGYDSIVGSLGSSLLHVVRQDGAGKRLCDLSFPPALPATGVPYIERFAKQDCTLKGAAIRKGDRVRLYLDDGSVDGAGRPFFGKGRHSCLGEELSTWLWRTLTAELGKLPFGWTIEKAERRKPDWVFVYYSSILVRLHG
jgi:cytochrome P450